MKHELKINLDVNLDVNLDHLIVGLIWFYYEVHLFALQNIPALTAGEPDHCLGEE